MIYLLYTGSLYNNQCMYRFSFVSNPSMQVCLRYMRSRRVPADQPRCQSRQVFCPFCAMPMLNESLLVCRKGVEGQLSLPASRASQASRIKIVGIMSLQASRARQKRLCQLAPPSSISRPHQNAHHHSRPSPVHSDDIGDQSCVSLHRQSKVLSCSLTRFNSPLLLLPAASLRAIYRCFALSSAASLGSCHSYRLARHSLGRRLAARLAKRE